MLYELGFCMITGFWAIALYIEMRKVSRHNNQHNQGKELDTSTRTWDELRKFQKLVEEQPQLLGL